MGLAVAALLRGHVATFIPGSNGEYLECICQPRSLTASHYLLDRIHRQRLQLGTLVAFCSGARCSLCLPSTCSQLHSFAIQEQDFWANGPLPSAFC